MNPKLDGMTPKEASYWLASIFDQVPVLQQSLLEVHIPCFCVIRTFWNLLAMTIALSATCVIARWAAVLTAASKHLCNAAGA